MLRDHNLVPLSHQHQHALALCVRIERALRKTTADLTIWQTEIANEFEQEIQFHFAAEEQALFPAARQFAQLEPLLNELMEEHGHLRMHFAHAKEKAMDATELIAFAKLLSMHIRKEERQLFEEIQKLLSPEDIARLGTGLKRVLKNAIRACGLPQRG